MFKKLERNEPCWCGSGRKYKACHEAFDDKVLRCQREGHMIPDRDMIKTKEQIDGIRESGKINIALLDYVEANIREGMSTEEIDRMVYEKTIKLGAVPAPLHYDGYPKSVCTSINSQVCHGIPAKDVILKSGDIVNVDVSTIYKGYFSDSSRMFCIGEVEEQNAKLVRVAKECMEKGIEQVKPWNFLGDMGEAVQSHALQNGYSIVREIGGHGVGIEFHEDPFVSYVTKKGTETLMVPGMVFTIEPMVNMGANEIYIDDGNGWTAYTEDGKPSAQWEVTIAVTEDGYEILAY
ncbi:methionyl aminopeptidase [Kineothrix alysoides]|uniref:Methionine aminopeptidase n=1 Tax=Kineothrix alysoides TaxID=1469948 RepID=A0A4R1QTT3_9FIRM|nr:methionyl aminopeptidase [Kineothrix alysoides]TCL56917.1 methionyl aminopeptidase [Kineothrix alysoides]